MFKIPALYKKTIVSSSFCSSLAQRQNGFSWKNIKALFEIKFSGVGENDVWAILLFIKSKCENWFSLLPVPNNMKTIPSCSTDRYCRPKACFCCTCTEVLTPVDQLKPGDMFALRQSPAVHCD